MPLFFALGALGCQRGERAAEPAAQATSAAAPAATAASPRPADAAASGKTPAELGGVVLASEDIEVEGAPSCALTVRYPGGFEQPVTWNGERCGEVKLALAAREDLAALGQDDKLTEDAGDDLARMPGRRALYIEGQFASSLYPTNAMGRVYEVPLAD